MSICDFNSTMVQLVHFRLSGGVGNIVENFNSTMVQLVLLSYNLYYAKVYIIFQFHYGSISSLFE